jgi:drug/metabolite transporter (DMT)-like permease
MSWLVITIFSYFLLAFNALGDRYLLLGRPKPKAYTVFINAPGAILLLLAPFVGLMMPNLKQAGLILVAGGSFAFACFFLYSALEKFEASRVVPSIGGLTPIFTLAATYVFFAGEVSLNLWQAVAFLLLVAGSILVSLEKGKNVPLTSFVFSLPAALLFSASFVALKQLYLEMPFWTVLIFTRVAAALVCLVFLLDKPTREQVLQPKTAFELKTGLIFLANQAIGGSAVLLQNFAVLFVPLGYLAFINALEGTRYVFLLILSVFVSMKFPTVLKEEISPKAIFQKATAIIIILAGLLLLAVFTRQ